MNKDRFIITVQAMSTGPEAIRALRHGLKLLLRSCGLRCVRVERVESKQAKTVELT